MVSKIIENRTSRTTSEPYAAQSTAPKFRTCALMTSVVNCTAAFCNRLLRTRHDARTPTHSTNLTNLTTSQTSTTPLVPDQNRIIELNNAFLNENEQTKLSAAKEIDELKETKIKDINFCTNWDAVTKIADLIAFLHGKPTYTQDVDTYADVFTNPKYAAVWKTADLNDMNALKEDMRVLAKLQVLGEAKIPVLIMRGGKLTNEQREKYLTPIAQNTINILSALKNLPKFEEYIAAIKDEGKLGSAALLLKSIAAMDQPRAWRIGKNGCDERGKYFPKALLSELNNDPKLQNIDIKVKNAIINIWALSQVSSQGKIP